MTRTTGASNRGVSLGVDVGGTFTDLCLVSGGRLHSAKVPTNPADVSASVLEGVTKVLQKAGVQPGQVQRLIHGTTIAINTLLERKGAVTGLLVTKGTRDVLEIGRQDRMRTYDFFVERPPPFVPRHLRREVEERLDYRGEVLVPLRPLAVREAVRDLVKRGVRSLAICFLHSYRNDAHERLAEQVAHEVARELLVSTSSDVVPEFREYERMSTTVINAYVRAVITSYVRELAGALRSQGIAAPVHLMRSDGGMMSSAAAERRPVFLVESGAASGVAGAEHVGRRLRMRNLVSFDMGGTTAKACLIEAGTPSRTTEYRVDGYYPILTPMLDVVEVGAGGGSIAYVDAGGALKVGPQSAGASPGPACYSRGGTEPTVTDANLLLGRLNPASHLGGELPLDFGAARASFKKLARRLSLSIEHAAEGVLKIVEANMTNAIRLITVNRGRDPRDFTLFAFGGAGPMHATLLAEELGMRRVYVPSAAGTFSALGMLTANLKEEHVRTELIRLEDSASSRIASRIDELVIRTKRGLQRAAPRDVHALVSADLRYIGQSFEVNVPLDEDPSTWSLDRLRHGFHATYGRLYGSFEREEDIELVNIRCTLVTEQQKPPLPRLRRTTPERPAPRVYRRVVFERATRCPILKAAHLGVGADFHGPTIVESDDTTVVVPFGWIGSVDALGGFVLTRG